MKKLRLIKYPGSKWVSIPDIREVWKKSNMEAFADIFGGSATVSLNMGAENVIYNELNTELYNLLLSLRDSYDSFMEYVKQWLTSPKSFMEFRKQMKEESDEKREDKTYSAFKTFYRYNTTFGGMGETYSTSREKSTFTAMGKTIGVLPAIHKTISTWKLENMDFLAFIRKYDSEKTFLYMDPPYPGKNWYEHNFSIKDYRDLSSVRKEMRGKYLMNFDRGSEQITKVFGEPQFIRKYENKNGNGEDMEEPFRYISFYTNVLNK